MHENPKRRRQRGFTLIEIMVVVVIIGLLATLVAPNVMSMFSDATETKARSDTKAISDAAKQWMLKHPGRVPTLEDLITRDDKGRRFLAHDEPPKDPWGQEYELRRGENEMEVIAVSFGPDMIPDTEDDITSAN